MRISRGKPDDLSDPQNPSGPRDLDPHDRSGTRDRSGATQAENSGDSSFSTFEASLLGCFGMDQFAERSHKELRAALIDAGLPGSAAGHLIRSSPMLERASKGNYRLRPCRE